MTKFYHTRLTGIAAAVLVIIVAVAVRNYDFRNTTLDYDEHKTIFQEIRLTNGANLMRYLTLENVWNYSLQDKTQLATDNNFCFPLYYVPMKAIYMFRPGLASLRLATIFWGVLSLFLFYLLGNRFGKDVGWIAFATMLLHPWVQHHTIHIRFYELWSLAAVVGLFYTDVLVEKIAAGRCRLIDVVVFPIVLLLPCTIHAFGILNILCLSAYFALTVSRRNEITFRSFLRREWTIGVIVLLILGVIVVGNMAAFGYATLIDGLAEDWIINSTSFMQIWVSFVFNVGYLSPLIVTATIILILFRRDLHQYRRFVDLVIAVAFSLIPALLITAMKPYVFRSDYLYGVLPYVLLIVALSVDTLGRMVFRESEALA